MTKAWPLTFRLDKVSNAETALAFVRDFGLLRHGHAHNSTDADSFEEVAGYFDESADDYREPLDDFIEAARTIHPILKAGVLLRASLERDDLGALTELRSLYASHPLNTDLEYLQMVSQKVAHAISQGLWGADTVLFAAAAYGGAAGEFHLGVRPRNLLGVCYLGAAQALSQPYLQCRGCDGYFFYGKGGQQSRIYCDSRCGDTARHRRYRDKRQD